MNLAYLAYNLISTLLLVMLLPFLGVYLLFSGRRIKGLAQRLGRYPRQPAAKHASLHCIWLHAASVGEVRVAAAVITALDEILPGCDVVLSTVTAQGFDIARSSLGSRVRCIYAPLDLFFAVAGALSFFAPDALICLETEIWPNLLVQAHYRGTKTALINGRISDRSIHRYLRIRPFMRPVLAHVDAFSMIREEDARRIRRLGAPPRKITVGGNAKFDLLLGQADPFIRTRLKALYHPGESQKVFVAGSIRSPEEAIIVEVYETLVRSFPDLIMIIAPRHVNRARQIESRLKDHGIVCQLRSEFDPTGRRSGSMVVVLDTIGELQATYSIADVVFCGASLAPLGGQNVLEAAVWGKPVLYGPSMEDFLDARELLDSTGGGIEVTDGPALAEKIQDLLAHPETAHRIGRQARRAVEAHQGAARQHAEIIQQLILNR